MNQRPQHPSPRAAERHLADIGEALEAVRNGRAPSMYAIAWPAGLDRGNILWLPIMVRARNHLLFEGLTEGANALTVFELSVVQDFTFKRIQNLLLTLEMFLTECIRVGATQTQSTHGPSHGAPAIAQAETAPAAATIPPSDPRIYASIILNPILAAGAELYGAQSLADALSPEFLRLASRMGIESKLASFNISGVVEGTPGPVSLAATQLGAALETTSETERMIIEHRLLRTRPLTLEEIGARVGVTRERIRQIQLELERKIRRAVGLSQHSLVRTPVLGVVASVLSEQFGHMVSEGDVQRRLDQLLSSVPEPANGILRRALLEEMNFELYDGIYVDEPARQMLRDLGNWARELADDVGLVDEEQLASQLPSEEWRPFWPLLRSRSGLHRLYGTLALRDSAKARAKAALLSIGRPASRAEIGAVCGFEERRVGACLSNVPSVVRADKERWGLKEWVDDEYDGIAGEIIQRIEEDGGSTTTERLLTELPSKFNVSPASVRAYMQTPRFDIRGGSISLASSTSVRLRSLDDVIHGRDDADSPYWTFVVESRYLEGFSVVGVPPEFAKALGCAPDSALTLRMENLPHCRGLSLRWRLASTTGASIGYLAEPLRQLGLHPGGRARVTIKGLRSVALSADDGSPQEPQSAEADVTLSRILRRRRAL